MSSCVDDTNSIDLTIQNGMLTADLIVAPADGIVPNPLTVGAGGAYITGADGWIPLPATLTAIGGPVGNISYYGTSINLSSLITAGQRIKFTQNSAVHYLTVVTVSASQLTLYLGDGTAVDTAAVTLPFFSVGDTPTGQEGVGPLVIDTGDDVETLYFTNGAWVGRSQPVWSSANAAALTRTANTYTNMTAAGYAARQLPWRAFTLHGLTWQFRWTGGITYGAGQTSAGVRMTAVAADLFGAGGAQDTTNIFGEVTSFVAAAERFQDSGWAAINASVAVKDMLTVMPQFKSDGTRTVTISQLDAFSIRGRLVIP